MKKQQNVRRTTLYVFEALLAISLVGLVSCKKPKIDDEDDVEREFQVNQENAEGAIKISENYVPINWEEGNKKVTVADTASGKFVMSIAPEEAKKLKTGSLVTIDVDSTVFLRKIKKVSVKNGEVEMETVQGDFGELFAGSNFELCFGNYSQEEIDAQYAALPEDEPDWDTRGTKDQRQTLKDPMPLPDNRLKIYPSRIRYKDEETGQWVKQPIDATRGVDIRFTLGRDDLINIPLAEDGDTYKGYSFSAGVKAGIKLDLGLGFSLFADIPADYSAEQREEGGMTWEELNDVKLKPTLYFDPVLDWNATFYSTIARNFNSGEKYITNKKLLGTIEFVVGIIPVVITNYFGTYVQAVGKIEGGFEFSVGGHGQYKTPKYIGAAVKKGKLKAFSGGGNWTYTAKKATSMLNVGADFKFYIVPEFYSELYGVVGPKFNLKPFVHFTVAAGAGVIGGTESPLEDVLVSWNLNADLKAAWAAGVSAGLPGVSKDIMTEDQELPIRVKLMQMPSGLSMKSKEEFHVGSKYTVEMNVGAFIFGFDAPCFIPTFVVFTTEDNENELFEPGNYDEGKLFSTYSRASSWGDGLVSIGWAPKSKNSTLTATVYDGKGGIISSYAITPDEAPERVESVDLGCSVLWANMNVGAETDSDFGSLVGWGDKTGEHTRQWIDKKYGDYYDGMDYCLDWYGGLHQENSIQNTRHDYARANWGGSWRMPAKGHWEELLKKCTWEWDPARHAYKVSGNGNYIYLPASGYKIGDEKNEYKFGESCEYWSATLDKDTKENYTYNGYDYFFLYPNAWYFYAEEGQKKRVGSTPRCYRQAIRPVKLK